MGQEEVYKFLQENAPGYYSAEELANELEQHLTNIYKALEKLKAAKFIRWKETPGKQGNIKVYAFFDNPLQEVLHEYKEYRNMYDLNSEALTNLMLLAELRKQR